MNTNLFKFTCGNQIWTYASGNEDITSGTLKYTALAIQRGGIDVNHSKSECDVTMPCTAEPANYFALFNPPGVLWLEITSYPSMYRLFIGKVVKCSLKATDGIATLSAVSLQSVLAGSIPNETYSTTCELDLFDVKCGVAESAHSVTLTVGSFTFPDPLTLQAGALASYPNGHFAGGLVQCGMESSFVIAHTGVNAKLMYPLQTWADQSYLVVSPGCNKTLANCRNKFANEVNFGGCPFIPNVNLTTQGW